MPKLALIIIDMVNDFFREGPLALRRADLVSSINELVQSFREHNQPVIWVRQEFAPDLSDAFLEMKKQGIRITIAGTEGCQLLPELRFLPTDPVIVKKRYSAFFRTGLDEVLASVQPDLLVVAGINTHACVRTTILDAYQRDYEVVVAFDCVASYDQQHHDITMKYLDGEKAQLRSNSEILALLG